MSAILNERDGLCATPAFLNRAIPLSHGLTVKETAFESLPPHVFDVVVGPVPPTLEVVPPVGGLSTRTCNVPGCAMSEVGIVATN